MAENIISKLKTDLKNTDGLKRADIMLAMAEKYIRIDIEQALENAETALLVAEEFEDDRRIARICILLGNIHLRLGNHAKSLQQFKRASNLNRQKGDKIGLAYALSNSGNVLFYLHDFEGALANYKDALKLHKELGNKKEIASLVNNLSNVYIKMEDYKRALEFANQALSIKMQLGDEKAVASAYHTIGTIYQLMDETEDALENLNQAYKLRERIGDEIGLANTFYHIAEIYLDYGDSSRALGAAKKCYQYAYKNRKTKQAIESMILLGEIYLHFGDTDTALSYLEKGLLQSKKIKSAKTIARAHRLLGKTFTAQNNQLKAMEHNEKYTEIFEKIQRKELDDKVKKIDKYNRERKEIEERQDDSGKVIELQEKLIEKDNKISELKAEIERIKLTKQHTKQPDIDLKEMSKSFLYEIIDSIYDIIIYRNDKDLIYNKITENILDIEDLSDDEKYSFIENFIERLISGKEIFEKLDNKRGIVGDIIQIEKDDEGKWILQVFIEDTKVGKLIVCRDVSNLWTLLDVLDEEKSNLRDEKNDIKNRNNSLKEILFHIEEEKVNYKKKVGDQIFRTVVPTIKQIENEITDGDFSEKYADISKLFATLQDDFSSIFLKSGNIQEIYTNLSSREIEVSNLIRNGLSSKEIAERLDLSTATINRHRNRIRKKLDLVNKKQSLKSFLRNGLN